MHLYTNRRNSFVLLGIGLAVGFWVARSGVGVDSSVEAAGGKVKSPTGVAPGRIAYVKPGWGWDPEGGDREFTFEVGFRFFF